MHKRHMSKEQNKKQMSHGAAKGRTSVHIIKLLSALHRFQTKLISLYKEEDCHT